MTAPKIVVYQFPGQRGLSLSPYTNKVLWALHLKQLPHEQSVVRFARGVSATRRLPVLDYDGTRVHDSTEILRFLEVRHPETALVPAEPRLAARARLIEDWADESLSPLMMHVRHLVPGVRRRFGEVVFPRLPPWLSSIVIWLRGAMKPAPGGYYGRLSSDVVRSLVERHFDTIEAIASDGEWLAGEWPTIADLGVAAPLYYLMDLDVPMEWLDLLHQRPNTVAWLRRFLRRAMVGPLPDLIVPATTIADAQDRRRERTAGDASVTPAR